MYMIIYCNKNIPIGKEHTLNIIKSIIYVYRTH